MTLFEILPEKNWLLRRVEFWLTAQNPDPSLHRWTVAPSEMRRRGQLAALSVSLSLSTLILPLMHIFLGKNERPEEHACVVNSSLQSLSTKDICVAQW